MLAFRAYTLVHQTRSTPRRWPPPAKNRRQYPVVYFHRSAPVLAFRAYTLSSSDPTYTTPLATAGEDSIRSPRRVLPQERSRAGVQGVHVIVIGPDVHHAVGHRRRRDRHASRRVLPQESSRSWRSRRKRYGHQTRRTPRRWPPPAKNRRKSPSCTSTGALPCWRSGRTRYCHRTRRTPRRWPPPAKNDRLPVMYFHRSAPVLAFRAYRLLSHRPDVHHAVGHRRRRLKTPPVAYFHRSAPVAGVQGVHVIVPRPDVHHAVGDRGRRLKYSTRVRELPLNGEVSDRGGAQNKFIRVAAGVARIEVKLRPVDEKR